MISKASLTFKEIFVIFLIVVKSRETNKTIYELNLFTTSHVHVVKP